MNKRNFTWTVLSLALVGCGGSSGGGSVMDVVEQTLSTTTTDPVQSTTQLNDLVVDASDVYDPNGGLANTNACSAPFFETVAGVYEGLITVADGVRRNCTWDTEITLTRAYDSGSTLFCDLNARIVATPLIISPAGTITDEDAAGDDVFLDCLEVDTVGEITDVPDDEPDLSTLTFPQLFVFRFDLGVPIVNGAGDLVAIFPTDINRGSPVREMELVFDGSGALTIPATTLIDPIWATNITRTASDLDQ